MTFLAKSKFPLVASLALAWATVQFCSVSFADQRQVRNGLAAVDPSAGGSRSREPLDETRQSGRLREVPSARSGLNPATQKTVQPQGSGERIPQARTAQTPPNVPSSSERRPIDSQNREARGTDATRTPR